MIDHPQTMWNIIRKHDARPTHQGAETLFTALDSEMKEYAEGVRQVMDRAWETDGYQDWAPGWMEHCGIDTRQIEKRRREFLKNRSQDTFQSRWQPKIRSGGIGCRL